LFANPQAWTCLDEDEKKEILALLPDHVCPDPNLGPEPGDSDAKISPLPESFLRYDNNWRYGVRQFQIDLESGRHDPEWLRQASQAMEERAQGKFDQFKEEQYEEFWGQKQRLALNVLAGESSRVKLATLVENEIVKKGDVWKYCRIFGKNREQEKHKIEKEAKVCVPCVLCLSHFRHV
jgi:Asx homology domain